MKTTKSAVPVLVLLVIVAFLFIGGEIFLSCNQVPATSIPQASLPVSVKEKRPSVITLRVETSTTFVDSSEQAK